MKPVTVVRHEHATEKEDHDWLALEHALHIDIVSGASHRRNQTRLTTTMRTPGADVELSTGLLFSLGIIENYEDIVDIVPCARNKLDPYSTDLLTIFLEEKLNFLPLTTSFGHARYSSCGICGSHDLLPLKSPLENNDSRLPKALLWSLAEKMKQNQTIFQRTGGTHAAAFFNTDGDLLAIFEDVGRHNALDKLIGHFLMKKLLWRTPGILLLSSRASYEIIEKAARAGMSIIAAMGAVSSIAVELAEYYCLTLVGFLRADRFNVYTHKERIT